MSKSIIIRKQLLFCSVHTEFVPVVLVMCGCECTVYIRVYVFYSLPITAAITRRGSDSTGVATDYNLKYVN